MKVLTAEVLLVRRSIIVVLVLGLTWVGAGNVLARQETLAVVPSGTASGDDLADLFPISVDGQPVVVETWSGDDWLARLDSDAPGEAAAIAAAESLSAATDIPLGEIDVARASVDLGPDREIAIAAVRVPGSRAYDFVDAAVGTLVPDASGPAVGWGWAGEAWISFHVRGDDDEGLVVAYPAADTVWIIDARTGNDAIVEALPPQTGPIGPLAPPLQRIVVPALGVAASFPVGWAVETIPVDDEAQKVIDRSTRRFDIEAEWSGTLRAVGPEDEWLREAPMCNLLVFEQSDLGPRAWVEAVTEGNRCYLIDETPTGLVRARIQPRDCGRDWAPSQGGIEHFVLGHDGKLAYLNCWSKEPPGERGSAIAASIEFLPE